MKLSFTMKNGMKVLGAVLLPALLTTQVLAEGPTITGFVDTTYNYNFNNPKGNANANRVFDGTHNNFTLQNAEIALEGEMDKHGYRVDINYGADAALTQSAGFSGGGADQVDLQQAYVTVPCEWTGGTFSAGKWVTLLGREVIESGDNLNISRSFLFGFSIPFTHTGLKYDKEFNDMWSVTAGIVNGWDNLTDNNNSKSFIGAVGMNPSDKLGFYLAGIYGAEQTTTAPPAASIEKNARGAVTLLVDYMLNEQITLAANGVYGTEEGASVTNPGQTAVWTGGALYGTYAFNDEASFTVRYENMDDGGASRFGTAPDSTGNLGSQVQSSLTGTLQCKKGNSTHRLEVRQDLSNRLSYADDKAANKEDSQITVALQWLYSF